MIDNDIEKALAPDKPDWKEPLLAKFKSYAIGFGAAVLLVALLLSVLYLWKGSEAALAPQTEPTMTVYPLPQTPSKVVKPAIKKEAAKAVNKPIIPDVGIPITDKKTVKPTEPLNQFERDLANFESKL